MAQSAEGNLVSVGSSLVGGRTLSGSPQLDAEEALAAAGDQLLGLELAPRTTGTRAGYATLVADGLAGTHFARSGAFVARGRVLPAVQLFVVEGLEDVREVVVDAGGGTILRTRDMVRTAEEGTVYRNEPGAAAGGSPEVVSFEGDPGASPRGWVGLAAEADIEPIGQADAVTTLGNNADTFANWSNFLVPADQVLRPVAPFGRFNFAWPNAWGSSGCATGSFTSDAPAAVTNLFYHHNVAHDWFFDLGFTEAAGNLQALNLTGAPGAGDPIMGMAHAGAITGGAPTYTGRDNAYMLTLPDGLPAWSGMFLWEPIEDSFEGPCADGSFDPSIIYHEYAHAVSTRMVPDLVGYQGGSMGEAWSDFFGIDYLHAQGLEDDTVVGDYATGDPETGIRNWRLGESPTTYGDLGYDVTGPQVHADGEVWSSILWRLRDEVIRDAGSEDAGSQAFREIVMAAMPISAPDPTFIDMRDALLAAADALGHGDHADALWRELARSGLGAGATTTGSSDSEPVPAFDNPDPAANATISGTITNASSGAPVAGARVILGEFEARVTPAAVTDETGAFSVEAQEGSYPLLVQAPGFGAQRRLVTAGEQIALSLAPNLASSANGAGVSVSAAGLAPGAALIDDTEATAWSTGELADRVEAVRPSAVIELAAPATSVESIAVSAFKNTGSNRFVAAREVEVSVSTDGTTWQPYGTATFPSRPPRPKAPDLTYRTVTTAAEVAPPETVKVKGKGKGKGRGRDEVAAGAPIRFVKVTILSTQASTTEVPDTPLLADDEAVKRTAELAEVQVFGPTATPVGPIPVEPADPYTSPEGTILLTNPVSDVLGGVTENAFAAACDPALPTQGADGWVFEIPERLALGNATVTAFGANALGLWDLDLVFYSSSCSYLGSAASAAADESGSVPYGTRYVVVNQWLGAATTVHVEVTPSG